MCHLALWRTQFTVLLDQLLGHICEDFRRTILYRFYIYIYILRGIGSDRQQIGQLHAIQFCLISRPMIAFFHRFDCRSTPVPDRSNRSAWSLVANLLACSNGPIAMLFLYGSKSRYGFDWQWPPFVDGLGSLFDSLSQTSVHGGTQIIEIYSMISC